MSHPASLPARTIAMVAALLALLTATPGSAAEPDKSMALRGVMQQLGQDMQIVVGAISTENWALVAELAPKVARHAEPPPQEKVSILTWLGTDAAKFSGFDHVVHEAAEAMGAAARQGDGKTVIASFAKVQEGCLACHQAFRKPFVEHFYKGR